MPYAPVLARCYDAILDARFDDAEAEIGARVRPRAGETCALMRATAALVADPARPGRHVEGRAVPRRRSTRSIASMERWTAREPNRADAWFFLGAAYGLRVQFRVLRGERLAAARDGKRIKDALERSLALDPTLQDAYFGIGLYHYYADDRAGRAQAAALDAVPARRQPGRGAAARCCARATAASCCAARPTSSCRSSISGTRRSRTRR